MQNQVQPWGVGKGELTSGFDLRLFSGFLRSEGSVTETRSVPIRLKRRRGRLRVRLKCGQGSFVVLRMNDVK